MEKNYIPSMPGAITGSVPSMHTVVGLLPAAGLGTRLSRQWPKELASLSRSRSLPICLYAINAMKCAGVARIIIVISPQKQMIPDVLGTGDRFGAVFDYVIQPQPLGLANVVYCARDHLGDNDVIFAMPDTIFKPKDALNTLHKRRVRSGADLILGIFPTNDPTSLAPVRMMGSRVDAVLDKPNKTRLKNTWGALAWNAAFTRYCCHSEGEVQPHVGEGILTRVLNSALQSELNVVARRFSGGSFCDAGTPTGLRNARSLIKKSDLVTLAADLSAGEW